MEIIKHQEMKKLIVLTSGGMDSGTLLYHLKNENRELKALSIDYGQRHKKEINCAKTLAEKLGIEHRIVNLSSIATLFGSNSLTDSTKEVPDGHYEEEQMKQTVVPNRNMIMLSVAIAWAISSDFDAVAYAAHSGDHAIYPDCRPEFADAMDTVTGLCDWKKISLHRPFVSMDKIRIAKLGHELGVPFEHTWTCYKGREKHCGTCGACNERKEAFFAIGIPDPVHYER
jgi:7-cyano-7-deazaguanine synthase